MSELLHLLRITFEAVTPLSAGSGNAEEETDVALVRDANGLPVVPAATIQGVLRHICTHEWGEEFSDRLFGRVDENNPDNGTAGKLFFGFALPHGANDRAVNGLLPAEQFAADTVLHFLRGVAPVLRDHVKLNARQVVDDRAKFDRAAVPAGTRFSFEVAMWGDARDAADDQELLIKALGLLQHPACRLGGAGARGYGRIKILKASYQQLACATGESVRHIRRQPPSQGLASDITTRLHGGSSTAVSGTLVLNPLGYWRIGADQPDKDHRRSRAGDRAPAMTYETYGGIFLNGPQTAEIDFGAGNNRPDRSADKYRAEDRGDETQRILREPRIDWTNDNGIVRTPREQIESFPVPASSVRGALAHRALFHWNAAHGRMIDADSWLGMAREERQRRADELAERPEELALLFGSAKERAQKDREDRGSASLLLLEDGTAHDVKGVQPLLHNSIDRFTGGVRMNHLYTEEVLAGGKIHMNFTLLSRRDGKPWAEDVRAALLQGLLDLTSARLAVGAKSHGFCTGHIIWTDQQGDWARQWRELGGVAR